MVLADAQVVEDLERGGLGRPQIVLVHGRAELEGLERLAELLAVEPGGLHDLANGEAVGRHRLEDAADEQLTGIADKVGHDVLAVEDDALEFGDGFGAERHRARHDKEEENA